MLPGNYFGREEFACTCGCGFDTVDAELLMVIQMLRFMVNEPITITSGCRCKEHNTKIGGKNSQHLLGRAVDIVVKGLHPHEVYRVLNDQYPQQYGIGKYDTFTHIDTRGTKARW